MEIDVVAGVFFSLLKRKTMMMMMMMGTLGGQLKLSKILTRLARLPFST
jgi:hypothetical protein